MGNDREIMNGNLRKTWNKAVTSYFKKNILTCACRYRLIPQKESQPSGRDTNQGPPKYKAGELSTII
jgi:hypothetical protein